MKISDLLRRKVQTLKRVTAQEGLKGLLLTVWRKVRQPSWIYRAEWQQALAEDSDYLVVSDVNGFTMLVNRSDVGIGRELLMFHSHEPVTTKLLQAFVHPGDTVLDIGANIGYYTLLLSRWVGPEGKVVSVEPHPDNFRLLQWNLRLNNITNAHLRQIAISDRIGTARLFVADGSNWHALHPTERTTGEVIPVQTVTIDSLAAEIDRPISLIRMDIEGLEAAALRGAATVLEEDRPKLAMEVHVPYLGNEGLRELICWLEQFGYGRCLVVPREEDFPWRSLPPAVWEKPLPDLFADDFFLRFDTFNLLVEPVLSERPLLKSG